MWRCHAVVHDLFKVDESPSQRPNPVYSAPTALQTCVWVGLFYCRETIPALIKDVDWWENASHEVPLNNAPRVVKSMPLLRQAACPQAANSAAWQGPARAADELTVAERNIPMMCGGPA